MILRVATANENHWEREGTTSVVPSRTRKAYFRGDHVGAGWPGEKGKISPHIDLREVPRDGTHRVSECWLCRRFRASDWRRAASRCSCPKRIWHHLRRSTGVLPLQGCRAPLRTYGGASARHPGG